MDSIVSAISAISEAPSQPDIVSSEQPDIVSSEQPDIVSSEQPDIVSSEQPEIVTSSQQSQEAPVTDSIFSASSTICETPSQPDIISQAPLQPSSQTRDPLIGGSGEANLSFELSKQEGK